MTLVAPLVGENEATEINLAQYSHRYLVLEYGANIGAGALKLLNLTKLVKPMTIRIFQAAPLVAMILACCTIAIGQDKDAGSGLRSFGTDASEKLLPGFGGGKIVYRYSQRDLDISAWVMRRYDENKNGFIEKDEADDSLRRYGDPFESDYDKDGRLSKIELAQRIASREQREAKEDIPRYSPIQAAAQRGEEPEPERYERSNRWSRGRDRNEPSQSSRRSREMAYDLVSRYDRNQDYSLDAFERKDLGINITDADSDVDGLLSFRELDGWLFRQIGEEENDLTDVLPDWFFERDANQDGQLELAEFTTEYSPSDIKQFESMDSNDDGLLTDLELANAKSVVGGSYAVESGELLAPRKTVTSELIIDDEAIIADLNVKLTLTHSYLEQLDGFLISPDGEEIELFTAIGGSNDNFEGAIFDDASGERITRTRPPYNRTYQPEAVEKKQASLDSLKGKQLKGTWKLQIKGSRNTRFGLLHGWSLIVIPEDNRTTLDK